jgi:hypothetical protein
VNGVASEAHDSARRRLDAELSLDAELVEQDRLSERYDAAIGTSSELAAYARLRAAGEQVAAREAWLNSVDDEGYRGLMVWSSRRAVRRAPR